MAANTLTAIMPKILAAGMSVLRENATMLRIVNTDFRDEAAQKGETINVPVSVPMTATAVTPGNVLPDPDPVTPTTVDIKLDQWFEAKFKVTDKEKLDIDAGRHFIPGQTAQAARALAYKINATVWSEYLGVYGIVDNITNGPFYDGTNYTHKSAVDVAKVLDDQLAPDDGMRRLVMNTLGTANARMVPQFTEAHKSGKDGPIIRGELGTFLNFDFFSDHQVPLHTAGTITTGLIAKASTAQAIGLTTIVGTTAASTGACALKKGDIILIDGQSQTYTLTADATQASAATDVNLSISPALKVALVGSEAITVKPSHRVNMAFHREAIALAMRPLVGATNGLGSQIMSYQDPQTGIILRLEVDRQHKQESWSFDALWGVKLVRPELAARLAGAAS